MARRNGIRSLRFILTAVFCAGAASSEPLVPVAVPAPLEPWTAWVLQGHESERCPFFHASADRRACRWPSTLALDLTADAGHFSQEWFVHHADLVPLPGSLKHWPQDVRADGERVAVIARAGVPHVRLAPGAHTLTGNLPWDALPELLQIPADTGIVRVKLEGREFPFARRDAQGRLWLAQRSEAPGEGDEHQLDVSVHRRLTDEIPARLETQIELTVSGRSREVRLGRALPDDFTPLALQSPLPARLDSDGHLRVQVRPGTWRIDLVARSDGPVAAISRPSPDGPWSEAEVWVFDARPQLRVVRVEDGVAVDPAQTRLPDEWKSLPAYLMAQDQGLRFAEKRRGDSDPAPDQLTLSRVLWLDFDGSGYTANDGIAGVIRRSTRLEMTSALELGRVAIGASDQLITRLGDSDLAGVEVAQGSIALTADSRARGDRASGFGFTIPAVGWNHAFQALDTQLNLPPGWRLLHASGVDRASTTWLNRWTLLDLFAVLLLAVAFFRLYSWRWGGLALLGLALTWTEPGAPRWAWAAVLAGEALRRGLPRGRFPRFEKGVTLFRVAALACLALLAIPFAVDQVRGGLFPALEHPRDSNQRGAPSQLDLEIAAPYDAPSRERDDAQAPPASELRQAKRSLEAMGSSVAEATYGAARTPTYAPDPKAQITTGPGLPDWGWTTVALQWSGPVESDQTLRLLLLPPAVNGAVAFGRVGLVAALWLCLLGSLAGGRAFPGPLRAAAGGLVVLCLWLPAIARADLPSRELLDELRTRLLANPECHPDCASIPRLALEVTPQLLRARIEVHVLAETLVPLPGGLASFSPDTVLIDGSPASGLLRASDGTLWARLLPGRHQIVLEGRLPERDSVEIPLPLPPHRVETSAAGWSVHGVHEDGVSDSTLQLVRIREAGEGAADTLEPGELPPFVEVEREITLGLQWQVRTTVRRLSPADTAVVLEISLLPGESVTSAEPRTADNRALVTMKPGILRVSWSSRLDEQSQLVLRAATDMPAIEVWRLDVNPVWHIEPSGIAPIAQPPSEGARQREWRPWPGEEVVLAVRRPAGVAGATATIDASELELRPGLRTTDATLRVSLRSSRGGQHTIHLPEAAVLASVAIDGEVQPIRQEGRAVELPLRPGSQTVELAWQEPNGSQALRYRGSEVDLGIASVNSRVQVAPSSGRWTLFVGGPRLGPAVLFWPLLLVMVGVAFGFGRVCARTDLTPLRTRHWLLLGIGLTQIPVPASAVVVAWLLALGWRSRRGVEVPGRWFDLLQVGLAGLSFVALAILVVAVRQGLLGTPEMQIAGNESGATLLRWYLDRSSEMLPRPWIVSVPLLVYRLAMLAWALWLAFSLVRWLRWGWACFSTGELWRKVRRSHVEI